MAEEETLTTTDATTPPVGGGDWRERIGQALADAVEKDDGKSDPAFTPAKETAEEEPAKEAAPAAEAPAEEAEAAEEEPAESPEIQALNAKIRDLEAQVRGAGSVAKRQDDLEQRLTKDRIAGLDNQLSRLEALREEAKAQQDLAAYDKVVRAQEALRLERMDLAKTLERATVPDRSPTLDRQIEFARRHQVNQTEWEAARHAQVMLVMQDRMAAQKDGRAPRFEHLEPEAQWKAAVEVVRGTKLGGGGTKQPMKPPARASVASSSAPSTKTGARLDPEEERYARAILGDRFTKEAAERIAAGRKANK